MSAENDRQGNSSDNAAASHSATPDKFINSGQGAQGDGAARNAEPQSLEDGREPGWVDDPGRERAAEVDPSTLYEEEGSDGAP